MVDNKPRFDVFLCHNSEDKSAVKEIGLQLKEKGLRPWLDEWELRPGMPWQRLLEEHIDQIAAAAVFLGQSGIGPWQEREMDAYLRAFVNRGCPVIPVILPRVSELSELPLFLGGMTWVDFRQNELDPLERLIWGITGERREGRDPFPRDNPSKLVYDLSEPTRRIDHRQTSTRDKPFVVRQLYIAKPFAPWKRTVLIAGQEHLVVQRNFSLLQKSSWTIPYLKIRKCDVCYGWLSATITISVLGGETIQITMMPKRRTETFLRIVL